MSFRFLSMPLLVFAAITGIASTLPVLNGDQLAQEADPNAAAIAPRESGKFLGVDRCERCHQAPTKADIDNRVTDFVRLNESKIWTSDIHSQAYKLIDPATNPLSKQICDKLHIADISQAQQCLSCHSNWLIGIDRPPTYDRGVACESCHGASEHWDVPHSRADWRAKPVAEKRALGMIDVRNPVERAEQCFGCHIGSAAEGKLMTHEMYAAGHPPLPGIEIESFAQQMPRHWRYLDEKVADAGARRTEVEGPPFANFQEFLDENHTYLKLAAGDSQELVLRHHHRSSAVVLGGVVALRESIELMRDLSALEQPQKETWPELAGFDCRACHHELTTPSRRQEQRAGSIPGRPMLASWPTALVRLAIRHVSSDRGSFDKKLAEFHTKLTAVQSELERSPFGSPSRVNAACSELSEWLTTEVVAPVLAKPFDDRAVADAVNLLIVIGSTEQHDYDSARQIAWALRMLSCDAARESTRGKAIEETLEALAPSLRLDLPNGPAHSCLPVSARDESRQLAPLAIALPNSLAVSIQYAPDLFRQQFQKLRELLR
ncbi:MAG: multiheme c-type cytochrome [Planctomycetota bacterium]|nr:multiheme c-type cytochrome [Planctomycetota bacterium]